MSERSGIEIDYCPECRGVWLDRGELDKIVERASAALPSVTGQPVAAPAPSSYPQQQQQPYQQQPYNDRRTNDRDNRGTNDRDNRGTNDRDNRGHDDTPGGYRKKKRENWLGELFDL